MIVELERNIGSDTPSSSLAAPVKELVRLSAIHKSYLQGQVQVDALRGVDLNVAEREMLAICGPSGSGKSTLLNIIGLLDEPTSGNIVMAGNPVLGMTQNQRADFRSESVGFIFQTFNLVPVLSALENVLLPLSLRGKLDKHSTAHATLLLEQVGLKGQLHAMPDRLSGGQRQRVSIARALIGRPRLVIADEPTANLDSDTSMMVMDLISSLRRDFDTTFVFSTHDERILGHMSRVVHLRDGRITQG